MTCGEVTHTMIVITSVAAMVSAMSTNDGSGSHGH